MHNNSKIVIKRSLTALGVCLALSSTSSAQENAGEKPTKLNESELEIISVEGIRGSLANAASVKRQSDVVSDIIAAEDIGKLPDENVAETLQRLTGVQIQRRNGEGSRVSVRGLVQNRIEVDGLTLVSPIGRRYSGFDELVFPVMQFVPSELLSGIEVFKTASADQVEGSLGGTVNLNILKPLSLGNKVSLGLQASYDDVSEDVDPRYSLAWSGVNEEKTLGALVSFSKTKRSVGEDLFFTRTGWGEGPDGDFAPGDIRFQNLNEDRDRTGILANLQWRPDDSTEVFLNTFYAEYDIERSRSWLSSGDSGGSDASQYVDDPIVSSNNTILAGTFVSQIQGNGEDLLNQSDTLNLSLGLTKRFDSFDVSTRISYGNAEQSDQQDFARIRQNGVQFYRDFRQSLPILNVGNEFDVLNGSSYSSGSGLIGFSNDILFENEESAFHIDANYYIDGSNFTSIEFGGRIANQKASRTQFRLGDSAGAGVWIVPTEDGLEGSADGLFESVSLTSFFDGNRSNLSSYLAANPHGLGGRNRLADFVTQNSSNGGGEFVFQPDGNNTTEEKTNAVYAKANFEGEFKSIPFSGNFGVRWVETTQDSSFFTITSNGAIPSTFERKYNDLLPSLNVKFELSDDLILRFAASEVIARPDTGALAGSIALDELAGTASGGNPELAPATAEAFDLSLEWYISSSSSASAAIFTKDVDGFLSPITEERVVQGATNNNTASPNFGTNILDVTTTVAGGKSSIDGIEIGYQKVWDNGLGTQLNYTYVDSAGVSSGGNTTPLEGLSENSYNVVIFYEQDSYSLRLAYNYRDDFLVSNSFNGSALFEKGRGQLDLAATYSVTENTQISFSAVNLNDEIVEQYATLEERPFRIESTGRRFFLGVRTTF